MRLLTAGRIRPQPVRETLEVEIKVSRSLAFTRRIVRVLAGPKQTTDRHALENAGNGRREA